MLVDALTDAAVVFLESPAGRVALDGAVARTLVLEGAPTRPGGPAEPLVDRLRRRAPLTEDTDWAAPLGPFRDRDLVPGSIGELCAARLTAGGHAAAVLVRLVLPHAAPPLAEHLAGARDEAERRDVLSSALLRALTGPLATTPLPRP